MTGRGLSPLTFVAAKKTFLLIQPLTASRAVLLTEQGKGERSAPPLRVGKVPFAPST